MVRLKVNLRSNAGFSLLELIVAAGVSVLISAIAVFAFMTTIDTYTRMVRQYEAEMEMVTAMMTIKSTLSSTVQMNYCGTTVDNAYSARSGSPLETTTGCIWAVNYSAGVPGTTTLVAMGVRDTSTGTDSNPSTGAIDVNRPYSRLTGVALYFQRPTTARSGALYVDQEIHPTGGWVKLSPVNAPFMYTRFVEFQIENVKIVTTAGEIRIAGPGDVGQPVISADFRLVMRYFTSGSVRDFRWEPNANLTQPMKNAMTRYYDIEKTIRVAFANNSRNPSMFLGPRGYGNMHMFKFTGAQSRGN